MTTRTITPTKTFSYQNTFTFAASRWQGFTSLPTARPTGSPSMTTERSKIGDQLIENPNNLSGPWQFACPYGHRNLRGHRTGDGAYCYGCEESYPRDELVDLTEQRANLPANGGEH